MQKIKLRTEESGKKLSAAYAPPKWSETAEEETYFDWFVQTNSVQTFHSIILHTRKIALLANKNLLVNN